MALGEEDPREVHARGAFEAGIAARAEGLCGALLDVAGLVEVAEGREDAAEVVEREGRDGAEAHALGAGERAAESAFGLGEAAEVGLDEAHVREGEARAARIARALEALEGREVVRERGLEVAVAIGAQGADLVEARGDAGIEAARGGLDRLDAREELGSPRRPRLRRTGVRRPGRGTRCARPPRRRGPGKRGPRPPTRARGRTGRGGRRPRSSRARRGTRRGCRAGEGRPPPRPRARPVREIAPPPVSLRLDEAGAGRGGARGRRRARRRRRSLPGRGSRSPSAMQRSAWAMAAAKSLPARAPMAARR